MPVTNAASGVPAGTMAFWPGTAAPPGWLKRNGAALSRTAYAALFNAIGTTFGAGDGSTTFNLPDDRGEFLRALDDGRGVDSGRGLGTFQDQAIQSHGHGVSDPGHAHSVYDPLHSHSSGTPHIHDQSPGIYSYWVGNWYAHPAAMYAGAGDPGAAYFDYTSGSGTGIGIYGSGTGISIQGTGGASTNPRNKAYLAIIKY